jgi:cytoskeleton protein RodZ
MNEGPSMIELGGQVATAEFAGQTAVNDGPAAGTSVSDGPTAGALLRRAREAAGLHVAALAVSLKVPVRKLEALEEDRWDALPDAVFVRALALSICRTLKIDSRPVLDRLPQSAAPRLMQARDGINTPFRAPSDGAAPTWLDQLSKPVSLAVFALLLGALVLVLLPSMQQDGTAGVATSLRAAILPAQPVPAAAPAVEPAAISVPVANLAQPVAAVGTASVLLPAAAAPATSVSSAMLPAATPASGIVLFRTKRPSWVEVTDAKGVVAVRRVLAAGEAAGAAGALPLQVIIGRADATEVQVRGKPFDLGPVSRDNVARFEVK